MATGELVLGIDFGTSYTSAGVLVDGQVELVADQGDPAIPSVVHVPRTGELVVGYQAVARAASDPSSTITSVKRLLGTPPTPAAVQRLAATLPHRLRLADGHLLLSTNAGELACEQIAAAILGRVRELAERRFGGQARRAVIAVPASATPDYVEALRRAARLAHLELVQVILEPIAGALALGLHGEHVRRNLVVCDFGGGTYDVSAVVQDGLRFSSVATHGEDYLGGDDLDAALAEAVAGAVFKRARFNMLDDRVRRTQLVQRCEQVKRALSSGSEARLAMREAYIEHGSYRPLDLRIDRAWVEPHWQPIVDRALACIAATLERAGWTAGMVDQVVMIGGSSAVPLYRRSLEAAFGARVSTTTLAGVAVAMGAALLTARHIDPRNAVPVVRAPRFDDEIPVELCE